MKMSEVARAVSANDTPNNNTITEYLFDKYHEKNFFEK